MELQQGPVRLINEPMLIRVRTKRSRLIAEAALLFCLGEIDCSGGQQHSRNRFAPREDPESCTVVINRDEDRLQCATMYRCVQIFVHIDDYGYLHPQNIHDNSVRRFPYLGVMSRIVSNPMVKMYAVRLTDSLNLDAFCALSEVIAR
jgi:hypothetical protein